MTKTPHSKSNSFPQNGSVETIQFSQEQFRAMLIHLVRQAGSMAELAPRLGITAQFLGDVVAGRKRAGKKLIGAFKGREIRIIELPVNNEGGINLEQ